MSVNLKLAEKRNISPEDIEELEEIHEWLEMLLARATLGVFNESVYARMEAFEFEAQKLWGFPRDATLHTWCKLYKFRCQWVGRVFVCDTTGVEFTIPEDVQECDFFPIGQGFVDVGRLDCYSRMGGVTEVKTIKVEV